MVCYASVLVGLILVFSLEWRMSVTMTTARFDKNTRLYEDVVVAVSHPSIIVDALRLRYFFNHASQALCNITKGRAAFGNVVLVHPPHPNVIPGPELPESSWQRLSIADFRVGYDGPVPTSVQSRGCSQSGDYIVVNPEFITYKDKVVIGPMRMKQFLSLWFRHRYGVFPEAADGFSYDVTTKNYSLNSCTDKPLKYQLKTNQDFPNATCSMHRKTGSLDPSCIVIVEDNPKITSSLLFNYEWKQIHEFCNKTTHNPYMTTPQNLLCNGKSVWEVVEQHQDFADPNEQEYLDCNNLADVDVNTVHTTCHRLHVLLSLNGSNDQQSAICRTTADAILNYVYNLADVGSELVLYKMAAKTLKKYGVKVTKDKITELASEVDAILKKFCDERNVEVSLEPSVSSSESSDSTATNSPEDAPEAETVLKSNKTGDVSDTSVVWVIDKIFQEIENEKVIPCDNSLLILTDLDSIKMNVSFAKKFKEGGLRVLTVSADKDVDEDLEILAEETWGRSYTIAEVEDNMDGTDSGIQDAFFDFGNAHSDRLVMIDESVIDNSDSKNNEFEFEILPEKGIETYHIHMRAQSNFTELQFRSPSSETSSPLLEYSCFRSNDLNTTYCNVPNNNKEILVRGSLNQPGKIWIHVYGKIGKGTQAVYMSSWLSNDNRKVSLNTGPLFIYSRLTMGGYPVVNAAVNAVVRYRDGSTEERSLRDDGQGVDILQNDGVYTGYIRACQERGRISIKTHATRGTSSCANDVRTDSFCPQGKISHFTRLAPAGSAILDDCGSTDPLVPFPVRDLAATFITEADIACRTAFKFLLNWSHTVDEGDVVEVYVEYTKEWPVPPPVAFPSKPEQENEAQRVNLVDICINRKCNYTLTLYHDDSLDVPYYILLFVYHPTVAIISNIVAVRPYTNISDSYTTQLTLPVADYSSPYSAAQETTPSLQEAETSPCSAAQETTPSLQKPETLPYTDAQETTPSLQEPETSPYSEAQETTPSLQEPETSPSATDATDCAKNGVPRIRSSSLAVLIVILIVLQLLQ